MSAPARPRVYRCTRCGLRVDVSNKKLDRIPECPSSATSIGAHRWRLVAEADPDTAPMPPDPRAERFPLNTNGNRA